MLKDPPVGVLWLVALAMLSACSEAPSARTPGTPSASASSASEAFPSEGLPSEGLPSKALPSPPNILFVLADDLGYADLGSYGNQVIATPNLDRLASEGLRFTSFYTNGSTCTPTRLSLMTGKYPQRFGVYNGLKVDSTWGLPADTETLPRRLQSAGYKTVHIGKWHLGHAEEAYRPLSLGFSEFFGFLHAHHLPKTFQNPRLRRGNQPDEERVGHLTDLLTDEAVAFLSQHNPSDGPFFLNLWFFSPHKPLQPPARWAERYDSTMEGRYAALVSALDEAAGRLLAALDNQDLTRNTVVVFMSDNGGVYDIHQGRNGPFRGGKTQLLEGGIRAPLIVRWPGRVAAGTVSDALTASFDLFPTLTDLAELQPSDRSIDGRSLLPLMEGLSANFDGPLFWEEIYNDQRNFAVRNSRWKLHSDGSQTELYDLRVDPGETTDQSANHPEVNARLLTALQQWRAQLPPAAQL